MIGDGATDLEASPPAVSVCVSMMMMYVHVQLGVRMLCSIWDILVTARC